MINVNALFRPLLFIKTLNYNFFIAAETAGMVLINSIPKDVVSLIQFDKATYRKMIQNLIWATGYNVVALLLAAGVLYKMGILLSPVTGVVLMSVSTVVVAINASLLKVK